ncbi:Rabenosyn Rab binding domain [Trinorchestia longiramus]|nr:Rabenosyn Rab binding domain [Trinorchestia longiramus]
MAAFVEAQAGVEGNVMEGFLCPVCLQDLTSIAQLQVHFEEKHSSEDKAVLNSLKSIFTKAKKFLNDSELEDDNSSTSLLPDSRVVSGKIFNNIFSNSTASHGAQNHNDPWNWHANPKGPQRSHTSLFKNARSDRIDAYVAETNKLLLRLDKLLTDIPSDSVKRKAQERELVPWVDDACVPLCPDCGRAFNALARRRHHCRLCGAIMCHNCSLFLSMSFAMRQRHFQPLLSLLYHKLMNDRAALERLLPQYRTMTRSLWSGESLHKLNDACELRMRLLRLGDSINATAQKIKTLGPVEEPRQEGDVEHRPSLGPRQELLQKSIYQSSAAFLKTNVLGLEKLPTAEELRQLQAERREVTARRLAEERKAEERAELRAEQALLKRRQRDAESSSSRSSRDRVSNTSSSSSSPRSGAPPSSLPCKGSGSVGEEGWGGDSDAHVVTVTDDPVVQQMNIIRNYIKQAREACRYEEVSTLEKNLKELQAEYRRITANM